MVPSCRNDDWNRSATGSLDGRQTFFQGRGRRLGNVVATRGEKVTIAAGSTMRVTVNIKRARWVRPLFTIVGTAITVLSLSATGPANGAGHAGERIARITTCDVD